MKELTVTERIILTIQDASLRCPEPDPPITHSRILHDGHGDGTGVVIHYDFDQFNGLGCA